jgi:hypothetical protein
MRAGSLIHSLRILFKKHNLLFDEDYHNDDTYNFETKRAKCNIINNVLVKFIQENMYHFVKPDGYDIVENMEQMIERTKRGQMKQDTVHHITNSGTMRMKKIPHHMLTKKIVEFFEHENQMIYYTARLLLEDVYYGSDHRKIVTVTIGKDTAVSLLRDGDVFNLWKGLYVCIVKISKVTEKFRKDTDKRLLKEVIESSNKIIKEHEEAECQKTK